MRQETGVGWRILTLPPKRTIQSFITAASERSCQHIENETVANEGEVGVGEGG